MSPKIRAILAAPLADRCLNHLICQAAGVPKTFFKVRGQAAGDMKGK